MKSKRKEDNTLVTRTEEIRARVEKATPEPWVQLGGQFRFGVNGGNPTREPYKWQRIVEYDLDRPADEKGGIVSWDDAQFIVNAREDVPYLLSELQALREENERLKAALDSVNPFSGGPDGDVCLWCNRDQPREWSEFAELFNPDNHDADCQLIAALSPSPAQEEPK